MKKILYLGSTSASRKMLLEQAKIPFTVIAQSADESECDWNQPLQNVVESIALYKMEQLRLPEGKQADVCYVVTADTLTQNNKGELEGKPTDRTDAVKKLISAREGVCTGTAFCLDRRVYTDQWHVDKRIVRFVQAKYQFIVPDEAIDFYLNSVEMLGTCAIAIEDVGAQFLKELNGSYTAVVGLPMYELRQALTNLEFFN